MPSDLFANATVGSSDHKGLSLAIDLEVKFVEFLLRGGKSASSVFIETF